MRREISISNNSIILDIRIVKGVCETMHIGKIVVNEGAGIQDLYKGEGIMFSTYLEGGRRIVHLTTTIDYQVVAMLNGVKIEPIDVHQHGGSSDHTKQQVGIALMQSSLSRMPPEMRQALGGLLNSAILLGADLAGGQPQRFCKRYEIPLDGENHIHFAVGTRDFQALLIKDLSDEDKEMIALFRGNIGRTIENFRQVFGRPAGDHMFMRVLHGVVMSNNIEFPYKPTT